MTPWSPALPLSVLTALAGLLVGGEAHAGDDACGDFGTVGVVLAAGMGAGAGASSSLIASGIIASVDDTRDYGFAMGAGIGVAATAGLSLLYWAVDAGTGCHMAEDAGGVAWSIPITMAVLGAAFPLAIWGAAEKLASSGEAPAALSIAPQPFSIQVRF